MGNQSNLNDERDFRKYPERSGPEFRTDEPAGNIDALWGSGSMLKSMASYEEEERSGVGRGDDKN